MSTRADIAAALATAVPAARVIGYAKSIDNIAKDQPVVMVYREAVAPSPIQGARTETVTVWVAVPQTDPATADDALDLLLDQVLAVLDGEPLPGLAWTGSEREALADAWPAYKIATTVTTAEE